MSKNPLHDILVSKNVPTHSNTSVPIRELDHVVFPQERISKTKVEKFAIEKYRKSGKGIKFDDITTTFSCSKKKAQRILKDCCQKRMGTRGDWHDPILFRAIRRTSPQEYFPTSLKAEIWEDLKNRNDVPIHPTGVTFTILPANSSASPLSQCLHYVAIQTLEGYVLPLLSEAPLFIHNMHFKTKVPPECYEALKLPFHKRNDGKYTQEIIGQTLVQYIIYRSGTVVIQTTCSNNPYRLETEEDRFQIIEFLGQIRAGLIALLCDKHERMIPHALVWQITECDINKDIKVSDLLHLSSIKIQVKHLDHIFRIYIKALGRDTVCRVEENKHPKKPTIEFISDAFNPTEEIQRQLTKIFDSLDKLIEIQNRIVIRLLYSSKAVPLKDGPECLHPVKDLGAS